MSVQVVLYVHGKGPPRGPGDDESVWGTADQRVMRELVQDGMGLGMAITCMYVRLQLRTITGGALITWSCTCRQDPRYFSLMHDCAVVEAQ